MGTDDRFKDWKSPMIEEAKLTKWNWLVQNTDGLKLGKKTDIGAFTYINAKHGVRIDDEAQIGSHCSIYSENTIDGTKGEVHIGKKACLGSHSVILPGVSIGDRTVVGAFSLVNKDLPPDVIAFGVPAKIVRRRDD